MTFLNSILNQSKKNEFPFDHWEYKNALSEEAIKEIMNITQAEVGDSIFLACNKLKELEKNYPREWPKNGREIKSFLNGTSCQNSFRLDPHTPRI